jgi:hypothetical protein
MANFKNNKPKKYKGCCSMCACKDHYLGVRNKRRLTIQEEKSKISEKEYNVSKTY